MITFAKLPQDVSVLACRLKRGSTCQTLLSCEWARKNTDVMGVIPQRPITPGKHQLPQVILVSCESNISPNGNRMVAKGLPW